MPEYKNPKGKNIRLVLYKLNIEIILNKQTKFLFG